MRYSGQMDIKTVVKTHKLLSTLRENMANHKVLFEEAKQGYLDRAQKILNEKLNDLRSGKLTSLNVNLYVPEDHSKEYETVIQMLSWTTEDEVTLSAMEFACLVQDQWEWMSQWTTSNSGYSSKVSEYKILKGL